MNVRYSNIEVCEIFRKLLLIYFVYSVPEFARNAQ